VAELAQLIGRYMRLKDELVVAYSARQWHPARVDRLACDLEATARQIQERQPRDEQVNERLPG
jgi:outer membrane murein-binding lipoprotein Lpp